MVIEKNIFFSITLKSPKKHFSMRVHMYFLKKVSPKSDLNCDITDLNMVKCVNVFSFIDRL